MHEIVLDKKGKPVDFIFLDVNPTYELITTLKKKNVVGKRGLDVIPNLEQKWIDLYGEVALTGKPVSIVDHSDFLDKYWDVKAYSPVRNQFAVTLTEITDRVNAENELKESEHRFRFLAENAKDMIYRMNIENSIYEYVSPASEGIFGYSPEEFYNTPRLIEKIIHPDWHDLSYGLSPK